MGANEVQELPDLKLITMQFSLYYGKALDLQRIMLQNMSFVLLISVSFFFLFFFCGFFFGLKPTLSSCCVSN